MKMIQCKQCGSTQFLEIPGYRICKHCHTRYAILKEELPEKETKVDLGGDIKNLLEKCRNDPGNAKKYAKLILDIDPTNTIAWKYL